MENKIINPAAINALKNALSQIYWYKQDLKTFLFNTIKDQSIFAWINWEDYKRKIVDQLVTLMTKNENRYRDELINLMLAVADMDDFTHLRQLEDKGEQKEKQAKDAVIALRKLTAGFESRLREKIKAEEIQKRAEEKNKRITGFTGRLNELCRTYQELIACNDPQKRGYDLERLMCDLFELFDLDPRASFKNKGEQIDGAFTFDSTDFLFEAKWQNKPVIASDLDSLSGKLNRKLDNTLGLFLSIYGFSEESVQIHSSGRSTLLLMDGSDLMAVLEERIDLKEILLRKRRHASQTGNIYLQINELLKT